MGWEVIKQEKTLLLFHAEDGLRTYVPDLYCIRSSIVDGLIAVNCTREEIVKLFADRATDSAIESITQKLDELDAGGLPWYQFTTSFEQAAAEHEEGHSGREPQ